MDSGRIVSESDGGALLDGSETSSGSLAPGQNPFSVEYFLDASIFEREGLEIPRPDVPVPPQIQACLGDIDRMRRIAKQYFDTVHTWMPMVFRQRFMTSLINQLASRRADIMLLLLCMKISIWVPQPDQCHARNTVAYVSAKKFFLDLEISGMLTLETLQAGVLICFFELGHAIYPSAYMTMGTLARYGMALGIDKIALNPFSSAAGWTRAEEVKRVWWAVLILDRYLTLGCPNRSLVTNGIRLTDSLPVDDEAWDRASPVPPPVLPLSCSTLTTGRFSRLTQAVYLLDLVLKHRSYMYVDAYVRVIEAAQLRHTLLSLIVLADVEGNLRQAEFCPTNAISYSALLLLHNAAAGIESSPEDIEYQEQIRNAIPRHGAALAASLYSPRAQPIDLVSPFPLHILYQAAKILSSRDGGEARMWYDEIKKCLASLSVKWTVARTYLVMVEARELA